MSAPSTEPTALAGTQTLMRGLSIVKAVADGARDLKSLCAATGVARSTAHRLASLLVQERYLRSTGSGYELGPELISLGFQAREVLALVDVARPHLDWLARSTGDTIHLVERDGDEVLYVEKIPGTQGLQMRSRVGQRMPLANTGVGKALLVDSDEQEWRRAFDMGSAAAPRATGKRLTWTGFSKRMRVYAAGGYAFDLEDNEPSIRCVAAPIRGVDGRIQAALSVTSTVPYLSLERMEALRPTVVAVAGAISAELGWRPRA